MFTYTRRCKKPSCGMEFDHVCAMESRDEMVWCPDCGCETKRVFTPVGHSFGGRSNDPHAKPESYWDNAEEVRVAKQKKRFKEHSEKYRHDAEYRKRENDRLVSRGIKRENLPE
jgi:hypothetical protein